MLMRVAVIELEAGGPEGLELGADLGRELAARTRAHGNEHAQRSHVRSQMTIGVQKSAHRRRRQRRPGLYDRQMQSHA